MTWRDRSRRFCDRFGLKAPVLLGPMAGVPAPALSIAVMEAGGMGACGALLMPPAKIAEWAKTVRARIDGPFQMNLWIPDPAPLRQPEAEAALRAFLGGWGPAVPAEAGDATPPDFAAQCEALLEVQPTAISSVMGLFPASFVERAKARGIAWIAGVSTLAEAIAADLAGADAIVVQGAEAGGHRAAFDASRAETEMVGLLSLVPAVADAVQAPVIAAGGIADGRTLAAALTLGASAVQIGTGFLRCPEADIPAAWADALATTAPEETQVSRVFSGRPGRSIATEYVRAATARDAPPPAPYPVQRGLTAAMREDAARRGEVDRMQAWAGQSAAMARAEPAGEVFRRIWAEAGTLLP